MMNYKFIKVIAVLYIPQIFGALPKVITPCPSNKTIETCLQKVLEDVKPYLDKGDFGEGFKHTPFKPLFIDFVNIVAPEMNLNMSNMQFNHVTAFKTGTIKYDLEKLYFDIPLFTPQIEYKASYVASVILPVLNVHLIAKGEVTGILKDLRSRIKVNFQQKDDLVQLKNVQYKIRVNDGTFKINTLHEINDKSGNSNNLLLEIVNNVINAEPDFFLRRIEPSLEQQYESILREIITTLFKDVKITDFFSK